MALLETSPISALEDPQAEPLLEPLSPEHLRALDLNQVADLAREIRGWLVSGIATTGGHLGSNLGAVEITLALHRVFESPADAIVWDTGHQSYVHKIVTGRLSHFATLRQKGGLSGYPNRAESEHDLVENSHASTALSYSYGIAAARRLRGEGGHVVAVIGDGALTGGLAYEALNTIGTEQLKVIVFLNDNGRSYAPTISRLARGALAGDGSGAGDEETRGFFKALGLSYLGPVDGHDVGALEGALLTATATDGPVVVHAHTVKGRGYEPAERDAEKCLHDVGPFDVDSGRPIVVKRATYTEAFSAALLAEAAVRPEVVAITAAMPGPTGLLDFARSYPERFFDVGIAEQHAVTAAAGMAMAGLRPVVAIYSTFLNRAWDQVLHDVALHRLPVIFCLDRAGITGDDGPSHHGVLDLAILSKVPGMTVLAPSSYQEVRAMLGTALDITTGPVAIRWPKTPARGDPTVGSGLSSRCLHAGSPMVCLVGVGKLVAACLDAAEALEKDGIGATVWDARCVLPLDTEMLEDAARHEVVVTAEDGFVEGGAGSLIESALSRSRLRPRPSVVRCGVPAAFISQGKADDILSDLSLDGPGLYGTALAALAGSRTERR